MSVFSSQQLKMVTYINLIVKYYGAFETRNRAKKNTSELKTIHFGEFSQETFFRGF